MAVAAGAQVASQAVAGNRNRPRRIQPGRAPVAAINTEYKEPSYGNWRVPRSAGLGNLGAIGTGIVMAGLLLGIISFAIWGLFAGLGVLAVAGALALLLTVKDKHGQSVVDRFATRMSFRLAQVPPERTSTAPVRWG